MRIGPSEGQSEGHSRFEDSKFKVANSRFKACAALAEVFQTTDSITQRRDELESVA
jgi:hypothetical protein